MEEYENTKNVLEIFHQLKSDKTAFDKEKPVIIDSSLAQLLGMYGMDGVITVEWEGITDG